MKRALSIILFSASLAYGGWFGQDKNQTEMFHENGRYQLIRFGEMRRDTFLLDTKLGKVFRAVCATGSGIDCQTVVWQEELVILAQ